MRTIESVLILYKILNEKNRNSLSKIPEMVKSYLEEVDWTQVGRLLSIITSTIDLNNNCIQKGIDTSLDGLKKVYDSMPHLLTVYAQQQ